MNLSPSDLIKQEVMARRLMRGSAMLHIRLLATILLTIGLLLVGGIEWTLFLEIFTYLKGGMPGEESQWSIGLLSCVGLVAILTYSLLANENPNAFSVRVIRTIVSAALPLYGIAMGLIFSAILWTDGADGLASPAGAVQNLFEESAPVASNQSFGEIVAKFPMVFVLGCSTITLMTLFAGHALIQKIRHNIEDIAKTGNVAREAKAAIETIRKCQQEYAALSQKRNALLATDNAVAEIALANEIAVAIAEQLIPYQRWLTNEQLRTLPKEQRLTAPDGPPLDVKAVQQRVDALKAITPKVIVNAMRN